MINRMCERPEAYPGYCSLEQAIPTFNPTSLQETEEVQGPAPIEEAPVQPQGPAVITPEPPKQETLPTTGQATQTETPKEPIDVYNTIIWTVAIMLLATSICTAYLVVKNKVLLSRPPSKIPTVQPAPPIQQPAQPSVQQPPSTESNKVINFIERKSKEQ